jgi:hypothetical protein
VSFIFADRVKETSGTTGTGAYSLAGAVTGFLGFVAAIGNGNLCHYVAEDGTNWEIGIGTVTDGTPDTLARTLILASSNAGAAVNWGGTTKNIFCAPAAADRNPKSRSLAAAHAISSTTATEVTGLELTNLTPGRYLARYYLLVQSATTSVGIGLGINFTGTPGKKKILSYMPSTGAAAATGVYDDEANIGGGSLMEARTTSNFSTTAPNMLNTGGFAAANLDAMVIIEVMLNVVATGNLELWHSSETATSTTVSADSFVQLFRIDT